MNHQKTNDVIKYGITISRGYPYSDDSNFEEISLIEWNELIEKEESLEKIDKLEGENPMTGEKIVVHLQNAATLNEGPILSWIDGSISTNSYSETLIEDYRIIADSFNAQIYGEEGETY